MHDIAEFVRRRVKELGWTYKAASLAGGLHAKFIANLNGDPGSSKILAICQGMNVTPNQFFGIDEGFSLAAAGSNPDAMDDRLASWMNNRLEQLRNDIIAEGKGITERDVLRWWKATGGQLSEHNPLLEHCDLYRLAGVEDRRIDPEKLGARSLAARYLFRNDVNLLRRALEKFTPEMNTDILYAHKDARDRGMSISVETLQIDMPSITGKVDLTYSRLILPVTSPDGRKFTLTFAGLL